MSDIYCPRCAEPWDLDCLNDEVSERRPDLDYESRGRAGFVSAEDYDRAYARALSEVRADFYRRGCAALGGPLCTPAEGERAKLRAGASAALHEVLGDDLDGLAAELGDAEALGLL